MSTLITFSSCFYIMKSKFNPNTYIKWMNHFISIVNNFNLVIYTDEKSIKYIDTKENPKIKIILKPFDEFYNYRYKDHWIRNHKNNIFLNEKSKFNTDWQINMLWNEKVWFVNETANKKYFDTDFYGWCDIGYFRNRQNDLSTQYLSAWPNSSTILSMNKEKIYYGCINNHEQSMNYLYHLVNQKNQKGLPVKPIPPEQNTVAGGFFIIHKGKIDWWAITYNEKLKLYLENKYLVKDDQIILLDCIFSEQNHFSLVKENNQKYDNWFMFQRILI